MIDIQAGDVVVPVGISRSGMDPKRFCRGHPFRKGELCRVGEVVMYPHWDMPGLQIVGKPGLWGAACFRKVTKADEGFSAWMHSLRPVKAREDA